MDAIDKITEEGKERRLKLNPIRRYADEFNLNVIEYHKENPFFYDKNNLYWFWSKEKFKWEIVDEIDLLNAVDEMFDFHGLLNTGKLRQNYINNFKSVGRKYKPKEPLQEWIQFKDKVFNIKTKETFDVTSNYFFCNPIDWELGINEDTPIMDKLFYDWVGQDYVNSLYEIIAYCCYRGYPIQTAICLIGSGRNGKSSYQNILNKFIGMDNSCSIDLMKLLKGNFEGAKLYKKLIAFVGETNFTVLSATENFKKLTGNDIVSVEYKGKDAFDAFNYAKMIIGTNNLPASTDTSEGWFRRWFIIDFPNRFPEGKDILNIIPDQEYKNLSRKIVRLLPEVLDRGHFSCQGTIEERQEKYIAASNPISQFIELCCTNQQTDYVKFTELYSAYFEYLKLNKRRTTKSKEFRQLLDEEGVDVENTTRGEEKGRYAIGIGLKSNWVELVKEKTTKTTETTVFSSNPLHDSKLTQNLDVSVVSVVNSINIYKDTKKFTDFPIIHLNCSKCNNLENIRMADDLMPYCKDCYEYVTK